MLSPSPASGGLGADGSGDASTMDQDHAAIRRPAAVLAAHKLTKRYGSLTAVDGLDLAIERGETYGFLGPNGAGKTTTLRMLAGLLRPTAGTAEVAGYPPGSSESLARIGCLIENPAFYPYLTGRENLSVVAGWAGCDRSRIEDVLDLVGLAKRGNDKFGTYSLGMRQRLGIAAALIKEPPLLMLDEPTNGLDPQGMVEMRELVKELGARGHTVFVSSHLLAEVEQMCTRVGVIKDGRLLAEGSVAALRGDASPIAIRATPEARAMEVLARLVGEHEVVAKNGVIEVNAPASQAAEINRALVAAGVAVSDFHRFERSLEDVFLEITGASQDH